MESRAAFCPPAVEVDVCDPIGPYMQSHPRTLTPACAECNGWKPNCSAADQMRHLRTNYQRATQPHSRAAATAPGPAPQGAYGVAGTPAPYGASLAPPVQTGTNDWQDMPPPQPQWGDSAPPANSFAENLKRKLSHHDTISTVWQTERHAAKRMTLGGQGHHRHHHSHRHRHHSHGAAGLADDSFVGWRQQQLEQEDLEEEEDLHEGDASGDTFMEYKPAKLTYGHEHPDPVVETASLAAVEPPDITYTLHMQDVLDKRLLSGLQLESIVYACQRHEQMLPNGTRAGFFIGDGAGVGKGRTIAGLMLENWRRGRKRHLWLSIGADLKLDSRRDLDDVGATMMEIHALNKLPYGRLDSPKINVQDGVVFLTYSSLISSSDKGQSRLKQLLEWCGDDFDGLIVYDECHKAKNLIPDAGGKPTKVGKKVLELQHKLPNARVVYCSATGASEPRNLGYMERLGLWGPGTPAFSTFNEFLLAVGSRGVGALELVAMDMKARGMYVCRTLSFTGAEFEVVEAELEEPVRSQYAAAARMWNQLRREFLYAVEQAEEAAMLAPLPTPPPGAAPNSGKAPRKRGGSLLWRAFWASHQRFFRHMCMAAKIPCLVRMTKEALEADKCVVIGLQSTGDARTADVVAEKGEELDDFVSGPRELLLKLVEDHYPLPANPDAPEPDPAEAAAGGSGSQAGGASGKAPIKVRLKLPGKGKGKAKAEEAAEPVEEPTPPPAEDMVDSDSDCVIQPNPDDDDSDVEIVSDNMGTANGTSGPSSAGPSGQDMWAAAQRLHGANGRAGGQVTPSFADALRAAVEAEAEARQAQQQIEREQMADRYKAAFQRKDQVKRAVQGMDLPNNPLDQLIDLLGGPDHVAEMTGRKGRLVRAKRGEAGVRWEARNASGVGPGATLEMINVHERELFLAGKKLVSVISEAASAGISLHADRRAKNQRRRVHLTLELPWSADKAIQQFGRSHRANQTHAPQYRLLFTPLGGERRFASAVARRLQSLGALTQGDRRAGGLSLSEFNYESTWGQKALKHTYRAIMQDEVPAVLPPACQPGSSDYMAPTTFYGKARAQLLSVGIIKPAPDVTAIDVNQFLSQEHGAPVHAGKIADVDKSDVPRFLNRLLGLEPDVQRHIFDFYQALLEATIERARKDGKYDEGIVDIKGTSVTLREEPQVIHRDPSSGAPTLLFRVQVDRGISWDVASSMLQHTARSAAQQAPLPAQAGSGRRLRVRIKPPAAPPDLGSLGQQPATHAIAMGGTQLVEPAAQEPPHAPAGPKPHSPAAQQPAAQHPEAMPQTRSAPPNPHEVICLDDSPEKPGPSRQAPAMSGGAAGRADPTSGFYRAQREVVAGRITVLLALLVPGTFPPEYTVVRPLTGQAGKHMAGEELLGRHVKLPEADARRLWALAYEQAGRRADGSAKAGSRVRELLVIGGLVLPVWEVVEKALVKQQRVIDRKMQVMRLQTTGESSRRLVGMLIPEPALEEILTALGVRHDRPAHADQDVIDLL
ncbi:hypothetical protein WJX72_003467 [[Myrmecia] bisecta]|uniref:Strawberry notch n=1 Tax=[Myrmecia] bisecta TaxID=41462 RepID=A0AAW1QEN0_9CHLO